MLSMSFPGVTFMMQLQIYNAVFNAFGPRPRFQFALFYLYFYVGEHNTLTFYISIRSKSKVNCSFNPNLPPRLYRCSKFIEINVKFAVKIVDKFK